MRRMLIPGAVALLLLIGNPRIGQTQIPVIDAANLAQSIAQWVQLVMQVANQVLELTPVDEIILSTEFQDTLDGLGDIITEAVGLGYDLRSLNNQITVLFDLNTAPSSMTDLNRRLAEICAVSWESYVYAMRAQTLVQTTLHAIGHLRRLVGAIGSFVGNMQGNQTMTQIQSTVVELLAKIQVQTATFDRAQSVERITDLMTMESLRRIQASIMADHPAR